MNSKISGNFGKKYFVGLALCTASVAAAIGFYKNIDKTANSEPSLVFTSVNAQGSKKILKKFDPNQLTETDWQKLGFSEKQSQTILKYRNLIGEFESKEQLKKCYAISNEKFEEIEPFIQLPNQKNSGAHHFSYEGNTSAYSKKSLSVSKAFNPDQFSQNDWIKLGFSEKQAAAITKYKDYLGGSFQSKEKFKDCFIISDENYKKLAPYLILPEKSPQKFEEVHNSFSKPAINYSTFDPNLLEKEGFQKLGFSEKQADVIINYRDRILKGSFRSLDDFKNCFVINEEKFEDLKPYISLNPANFVTKKVSTAKPEIKTDFSKTDLNQITYKQLLEFGLDEKSAGMLIGFRKKLGGFVNKQQILETYEIDKEKVSKLLEIAPLNTENVVKYTLLDAPDEWLKNHPYFKYSADKIIYYRISNPDEKKIWKFLKLKPEYEQRMRLYLK